MLSWIFIVLVDWNKSAGRKVIPLATHFYFYQIMTYFNSLKIMSLNCDALSWFWANQYFSNSLMIMPSGKSANTSFIDYGLTDRPRDEHTSHYTSDAVTQMKQDSNWRQYPTYLYWPGKLSSLIKHSTKLYDLFLKFYLHNIQFNQINFFYQYGIQYQQMYILLWIHLLMF